jgi:hypothetical protein
LDSLPSDSTRLLLGLEYSPKGNSNLFNWRLEKLFTYSFDIKMKMASSDESSDSETSIGFYSKANTTSYDSREVSIFRGKEYLSENAGNHISVTNSNVELRDNFSQLLILEATKNM